MLNPEQDFSKEVISQKEGDLSLPKKETKAPVFWSNEALDRGKDLALEVKDLFLQIDILGQELGTTDKIKSLHDRLNQALTELESLRQEQEEQNQIKETTPEGMEVRFELNERLAYWKNFYKENGVDWITLPESISLTEEQKQEMKRLIRKYGFNCMLIIPENIVGIPEIATNPDGSKVLSKPAEHYEQLHQLMSQGYNATWQSDNYKEDGSFQGSQDKTTKFRIILIKDIQELDEDDFFKQTKGESVDNLKAMLETNTDFKGLTGFSESEYLIFQRDYFKRTGEHLDAKRTIWLLNSERPLFSRVPYAYWYSSVGKLHFGSHTSSYRFADLGARFAGSFEINS